MKKAYFFVALAVFILSYGLVSAVTNEVLFEVHGNFSSPGTSEFFNSKVWGWGSFTVSDRVAVEYKPESSQTVCTAKTYLARRPETSYNLILSVYEGGSNPESGLLLGRKIIPSTDVPVQFGIYTTFNFDTCLHLKEDTTYWFTWTRSQLQYPYGFYSFYRGDEYPNTSGWFYETFGPYGWTAYGREVSLRLEGPKTKEPVIIVPGILGSRLNRVSDGEEVWPSIGKMGLSPTDDYLNELKLDNNGNEILDINSTEIIESVLFLNQYGELIQKFKDNGYEVGEDLFIVPYDWRVDISSSSMKLDSVVSQALANSPTGKVNFVAHSMGGLLVKDYLMRNGDSAVNKLVFAGTPHLGAPKAFNLLNWGDDFDLKFLGLGLDSNKAKEIGQNMPAVYQLLPSREYINKIGSYVRDGNSVELDYEQTGDFLISSPALEDHRNAGILTRADEFHQLRDGWSPSAANVYNLLGCREYDTIGSFSISEDGSVDIDSINGDGTVPFASAEHTSGNDYFVSYFKTNINHVGLISDDRTIGLIYEIITDSVSVLPTGISQIQSDCDGTIEIAKRLRFSTHSPVNLHVYDSSGNHTGLTPEGNIELGIPDSNFLQAGDSSFIFVPNEAGYSIRIEAYATGSFDFKINELENGKVIDSTVYDDVPIDNPNLEASFELADNSGTLNLDRDGDGYADAGYLPDESWIPYNATIQSTLDDLERVYLLGWTTGEVKNSLKVLLEASMPTAETVQSKGKKANGVLGTAFLKQLETEYNRGNINEKAFNIVRVDILWLLAQ